MPRIYMNPHWICKMKYMTHIVIYNINSEYIWLMIKRQWITIKKDSCFKYYKDDNNNYDVGTDDDDVDESIS